MMGLLTIYQVVIIVVKLAGEMTTKKGPKGPFLFFVSPKNYDHYMRSSPCLRRRAQAENTG